MKCIAIVALSFAALDAGAAAAQKMEITSTDSRSSSIGSTTNFSGRVTVAPLYAPNGSTSSSGGLVSFGAGARSAWHAHPAGQVLVITSGSGWVQEEGQPKRRLGPGDVVWTPPGVKHWHGASATDSMSHIAITNVVEGKNVDWMEQVSDEQYLQ
jgi:quercetin dioxygenase-like cupin family protein